MAERDFLSDIESLKHELYTFEALGLIDRYQQLQASKSTMTYLKKLWTALNTDIAPAIKDLQNQLAAIYNPQLVPVVIGDCIIDWVDTRTGDRPWL